MLLLWRKLVVCLRTVLLKVSKKEKIDWRKSISELLTIIASMLTKQVNEPTPIEPAKPKIPDYDIIPKPCRRLLKWLFSR